ncbi:MAG: outer membrane protein assembly factor, partial [Saprospiraceae bacterium]|nr:outer membrane protein assembly factor [Saprospiraceae bacterium]
IIRAKALVNDQDSTIQIIGTIEEPGFEFTDQKTAYQLRNIMEFDVSPARARSAEVYKIGDDYDIIENDLVYTGTAPISRSSEEGAEQRPPTPVKRDQPANNEKDGEVIRSSENQSGQTYLFQSEFEDMDSKKTERILSNEIADGKAVNTNKFLDRTAQFDDDTRINRLRIIPYRLKFQLHGLTTNVDNSLLFGGLDSYAGFKQEFEPVPPGLLLKATFKDLFEDYSFEGGVRFPTTFNGTEYFLVFDDNKKRIDKQYAFYRKTTSDNTVVVPGADPQRTRNTILLGHYRLKYPLDIYNSVRATATLRQDKFTFLATDITTLDQSDEAAQRIGIKLEYVFDNAIDIDLNIRSGTRFKFSIEAIKRFKIDTDPLDVSFSQGFMTVIGLDARQYFNFAKHSVFAVRGAAGTSFGSEKVLYYLGGTDNWLIPRTNQDIPQPEGNFAYQTISPNLRGFDYNIRNGSTFAILNAELRIPFVKYLSRRPIRMSLLRHLQLVGFADVGAAWEGLSPFDEDNPINILNLANPPTVFVRVNYFRDPLVAGYGVGIRTQLFGYFLRLDYAWGLETRRVQEPKLHFSMGVDF